MFSLTSSYAHSTLPKFIAFFQNFCMKLWLWSHRVQDYWLKSTPPQDVFSKELVPPGVLGEGGTHAFEDITSLTPAVWVQNLPKFDSFQVWKSGVSPWSKDTRQAEKVPTDPVFGLCILVPLRYIFFKLTYWNINITMDACTYLHNKGIHDIWGNMDSHTT